MAIQTISRQNPNTRPQFNPALVKPIAFQIPEWTLRPRDQLQFSGEGGEQNLSQQPTHLDALKSNFQEDASRPAPAVPKEANADLRALAQDWFPVYAPFLDLASLEALS